LNIALYPRQKADWGLRCAWGWAVTVALGGVLCALSLASRRSLLFLGACGLLLFFAGVIRGFVRWSRRSSCRRERVALADAPFLLGVLAIFGLALVPYLAAIQPGGMNGCDDELGYFEFAREILDTGTLTQPFSLRRAAAYGGKSLIDALQLAIAVPIGHLRLVDNGLALFTVLALIVGHARVSRWTARGIILVLMLLVVTLPDIRINTATTLTGVVFFLALYRTLAWRPVGQGVDWRHGIPVALLAAAACTLRQNYLFPVGVFLFLEYAMPALRGIRLRPLRIFSPAWTDALVTMALLILFLVPWWTMTMRSSGTFLFPLIKGNFNRDYPLFEPPNSRVEQLRFIWSNLSYCMPVKAVPLFLVAALTLTDRAARSRLAYFVVAAFVSFVVLIKSFPDSDAQNLARYYLGFTVAALIAIALAVADSAAHGGGGARVRAQRAVAVQLVLAGIVLQLYGDRDDTRRRFDGDLATIQALIEKKVPWEPQARDPAYAQLQDSVPARAPIAVMVDRPFSFDFARNRIASFDVVGAVSPPPGLPLFQGADAVADYLIKQGYHYAIVIRPEASGCLYKRSRWANIGANELPVWKRVAPFYLAAFSVFDELTATRVHYAETDTMTTIDLVRRKE
jgi:hypothetical protein